jgi:hypothetical protein
MGAFGADGGGKIVGVTEVSEKIWLVSFMDYDLGFFDHESGRVECAENRFGAKLLCHLDKVILHQPSRIGSLVSRESLTSTV